MLDPKKARPWNGDSKPATELTSTQLVIGTCIFLVAALICFALGFVLGRYEESSSQAKAVRTAAAVPTPEAPLPPAPRTGPAPPPQEGSQVSPRRVVMPPPKPQVPGYPSSPNAPGGPPKTPKVTDHAAPPRPEPSTPPEAPAPAANPEPLEKPDAVPAENAAASPAPPQPEPAPKPPEAPTPPAATSPPPAQPEPPLKPAVPPAATPPGTVPAATQPSPPTGAASTASSKGLYAIQVAYLTGPARKERAEEYMQRLEANSELKAELVISEDGKTIRVMIGNYPDRETATKACEELKKRAGFKDSFVKRR